MEMSGAPASPGSTAAGDKLLQRSVSKGYEHLDAPVDRAMLALACLQVAEVSDFAVVGDSVRGGGRAAVQIFVNSVRSTFGAIFAVEAYVRDGLVFRFVKRCGFEPRSSAPVDIDALVPPPPPPPPPTATIPPRAATRVISIEVLQPIKCDFCDVQFVKGKTNRDRRKSKKKHMERSCKLAAKSVKINTAVKNVRCKVVGCLVTGCAKKGGALFFDKNDLKRHRITGDKLRQKADDAAVAAMLTQPGSEPAEVVEVVAGTPRLFQERYNLGELT